MEQEIVAVLEVCEDDSPSLWFVDINFQAEPGTFAFRYIETLRGIVPPAGDGSGEVDPDELLCYGDDKSTHGTILDPPCTISHFVRLYEN